MQFFGFKPERASLRFQFRYCSKDHPEKVLGFARFLFLFRDRVVGFDVVCANTCRRADELVNDSICHRMLWNCFCEINDSLGESCRPFFQIVNALPFRLFVNDRRSSSIPERFLDILARAFGFRHSFVIRHSCLVIHIIH